MKILKGIESDKEGYIYFNSAAFERVMKYWINHGRRIERNKIPRKRRKK